MIDSGKTVGEHGRRNLDPMQFKLPVGREYELAKQIHGGNSMERITESSGQSDHLKNGRGCSQRI